MSASSSPRSTTAAPGSYPAGWNDPPTTIFAPKQSADPNHEDGDVDEDGELKLKYGAKGPDGTVIAKALRTLLEETKQKATISKVAMNVKMWEDANKKMGGLFVKLDARDDSSVAGFLKDIYMVTEGVRKKEFAKAGDRVNHLMTAVFSVDSAGNQWVLGLKRLVDLAKLP